MKEGLPSIVKLIKKRGDKTLRVWSAACSRGQEVYSLSMFLNFHLKLIDPTLNYTILGTDIDSESVSIAENGVYNRTEIKEVPLNYLGSNWAQGSGDIANFVKAKPTIRTPCRFETVNLIQTLDSQLGHTPFDIIFCRNVFIYFNSDQITKVAKHFLKALSPNGLLFVGISETLNGLNLPISTLGPSIYTHRKSPQAEIGPTVTAAASAIPSVLRVMCVDDSPSIHSLMKQVLKKEEGFEIVATAMNGLEASKKLKEFKVDLVTLDIHMPEQTGVEYLERNFSPGHPPVVMVSSVSRDDTSLAFKALQLGASDYVEKPALSNMTERGEEIRIKLRSAYLNHKSRTGSAPELDPSFKKLSSIKNPDSKVRIIVASYVHLKKLKLFFRELTGPQPPTYLLVEGMENALDGLTKELQSAVHGRIEWKESISSKDKSDQVIVMDFKRGFDSLPKLYEGVPTSILIFGEVSKHSSQKLLTWSKAQFLLEDLGGKIGAQILTQVAADIVPITSFAYLSCAYFSDQED
jgi:chemotaxis protein methyltransferase CheR